MRLTVLTGTALLGIGLAVAACHAPSHDSAPSTQSPQTMTSQPMTSQTMVGKTRTGSFNGIDGKHVAGTAALANGQLTLTGFSSDNGPDLHIYLTKGSDQNAVSAGKELGMVASDKADQTFSVSDADTSMYDTVLINCDKAKEAFGAAALM